MNIVTIIYKTLEFQFALGNLQAAHDYALQGVVIATPRQMHKEIKMLELFF